jgi:undecaprenyl pyrophosphate phosphatase UppP
VQSYRRGNWVGISTAATLIFLAMIMNQYEVWVVMRFSRLLIIPLIVAASQYSLWNRIIVNRTVYGALVVASAATNVAFSYYMVRFFS